MNLVQIENNQPVTSSLQVAEVFGKKHHHVMDSIKDLIEDIKKTEISCLEQNADTPMFYQDTYQVEGNFRKYPMFYMNQDGWTLLVMGYQGKKATEFKLQYMAQFKKMERELAKPKQPISLPQNYAQALRQLAEQVELNESLLIENKQLKQSDNSIVEQTELLPNVLYSTEEIAKEIGYPSARALNQRMKAEGIIYYQVGRWHLRAKYKNRGWKDYTSLSKSQKWTEKGREFIKVRFTENKQEV